MPEKEKHELTEKLRITDDFDDEPGNRKFLYITVCAVNLTAFACGEQFGWTSPIIPKLESNSTCVNPLSEPITVSEGSWIGSLLPIGASIGPFVAGALMDRIGRKNTLLLSTVPLTLGFFLAAYAKSVLMFYASRFIAGLSVGALCTVLPLYIAEVSEDAVRGSLSTLMQLFITLGILFSFGIGPYVTITTYNLLCTVPPLIFLFVFYLYMPETPHFLIAKGKENEARKSLQKLRSRKNVALELNEIKMSVEESMKEKAYFTDIFKSPGLKKAFIVSMVLMALQQFSGINVILFYTQNIFEATGSEFPPEISSTIIGAVQVGGSVLTPLLVDRKGKRFLLLISALFMAISEGFLGAYFHFHWTISWLPIACLVGYIIAYCLGFGPLPWAVLGEVFPSNIKSKASTVVSAWCWILGFILTKYFSTVTDLIGIGGSFWIFSGFCVFGVYFVYRHLPDTTGMGLDEIQRVFAGKTAK